MNKSLKKKKFPADLKRIHFSAVGDILFFFQVFAGKYKQLYCKNVKHSNFSDKSKCMKKKALDGCILF